MLGPTSSKCLAWLISWIRGFLQFFRLKWLFFLFIYHPINSNSHCPSPLKSNPNVGLTSRTLVPWGDFSQFSYSSDFNTDVKYPTDANLKTLAT